MFERAKKTVAGAVLALLAAVSTAAPASAFEVPRQDPVQGLWDAEGAVVIVLKIADFTYEGRVHRGSYGSVCPESAGARVWNDMFKMGSSYKGTIKFYRLPECSFYGNGETTWTVNGDQMTLQTKNPQNGQVTGGSYTRNSARFAIGVYDFDISETFPRKTDQQTAAGLNEDPFYELIFDESGNPQFVRSSSPSGTAVNVATDGATRVLLTELISGGPEAAGALMGSRARCRKPVDAVLRAETRTGVASLSLDDLSGRKLRARRRSMGAQLLEDVKQRRALATCLKKAGVSDVVTDEDLQTVANAMQDGDLPAAMEKRLKKAGATTAVLNLLRLNFRTYGMRRAGGPFPDSLARASELKLQTKLAQRLRR